MNDKRDEVIEQIDAIFDRSKSNESVVPDVADLILSREAEVRREIADELQELRSDVVDVEFLQGRLDIFEEQIRGNK